ncbi:hypothetical protein AYI70_g9706, partial [Smittium culicis]
VYVNDNGETVTEKIDDIDNILLQIAQNPVSKTTDGYFGTFYESDPKYLVPKIIENSEEKKFYENPFYSVEKKIGDKPQEDKLYNKKENFDRSFIDEKGIFLHDEKLYTDIYIPKITQIQNYTLISPIKQNEFVEENEVTNPSSSYWGMKGSSNDNPVELNNDNNKVYTLVRIYSGLDDGINNLIQFEDSLESTNFGSAQSDEGFYLRYYTETVFLNEDGEVITLTINEIDEDILEPYSTINSEYLNTDYPGHQPSRDTEIYLETGYYESNYNLSETLSSISSISNSQISGNEDITFESFTGKAADYESDLNTLAPNRTVNHYKNKIKTRAEPKLQKTSTTQKAYINRDRDSDAEILIDTDKETPEFQNIKSESNYISDSLAEECSYTDIDTQDSEVIEGNFTESSTIEPEAYSLDKADSYPGFSEHLESEIESSIKKVSTLTYNKVQNRITKNKLYIYPSNFVDTYSELGNFIGLEEKSSIPINIDKAGPDYTVFYKKYAYYTKEEDSFNERATNLDAITDSVNNKIISDNNIYSTSILYNEIPSSYIKHDAKEIHEKNYKVMLLNSGFIESKANRTNTISKKINELHNFNPYTGETFRNTYFKSDTQSIVTVEEKTKVKYPFNEKANYTSPKMQIYSRTIFFSHKTVNLDLDIETEYPNSDFSKKKTLVSSFEPIYNSKPKKNVYDNDKNPKNPIDIYESTSTIIQISNILPEILINEAPSFQILDQTKSIANTFENQNNSKISGKLSNTNIENSEESSIINIAEKNAHSLGYMTRTVIYDEKNVKNLGKKSGTLSSPQLGNVKINKSSSTISSKKKEVNIKSGEIMKNSIDKSNYNDSSTSFRGGTLEISSYEAKNNLQASAQVKSDFDLSKSIKYFSKATSDGSEIKKEPPMNTITLTMSHNFNSFTNIADINGTIDLKITSSFGSLHSLDDIVYTSDIAAISNSGASEIGVSDTSKHFSKLNTAIVPTNNGEGSSIENSIKYSESRGQVKTVISSVYTHAYPNRKTLSITSTNKDNTKPSDYKSGKLSTVYIQTTLETPSISHTPNISEIETPTTSNYLIYSTGYNYSIKRISNSIFNNTQNKKKISDAYDISTKILSSKTHKSTISVFEKNTFIGTKHTIKSPTGPINNGKQVGPKNMPPTGGNSSTVSILNNTMLLQSKVKETKPSLTKLIESTKNPKKVSTTKKNWGAGTGKKQVGANASAAATIKGVNKSSTASKQKPNMKLSSSGSAAIKMTSSMAGSSKKHSVITTAILDTAFYSEYVKGVDATSQRPTYSNAARASEYMTNAEKNTSFVGKVGAPNSLSALEGSTTSKNGGALNRSKLHGEVYSKSQIARGVSSTYNKAPAVEYMGIPGTNMGGTKKRNGAILRPKYMIKDSVEEPIELDPIESEHLTAVAKTMPELQNSARYRNEYNVGRSYYQKNRWAMTEPNYRNARTSSINPQYYGYIQSEKGVIFGAQSTKTAVNSKSPLISAYHTRQVNNGNYNNKSYYYYYYGETTSQANADGGQINIGRNNALKYSQATVAGSQKSIDQKQRLVGVPIYNYEGIEVPAIDTGRQNYNIRVRQSDSSARYPDHALHGDRRYYTHRTAEYPKIQSQYLNRGIHEVARNPQSGQTRSVYSYNQRPELHFAVGGNAYKQSYQYPTKAAIPTDNMGTYKHTRDDSGFPNVGRISQQHQSTTVADDAIYFDNRYGWIDPKMKIGRSGRKHNSIMHRADPEMAATRHPQKYAESGYRRAYQHAQQRNNGNTETNAANFGNLNMYLPKLAENSNNLERPSYHVLGNTDHGVSSRNRNSNGTGRDKHAPINGRYKFTPTRTMRISGSRPPNDFEYRYAYNTNNSMENRAISKPISTAGPNSNIKILFKVIRNSDKWRNDSRATRLFDYYSHIPGKLVDGNRRVTVNVGGRPFTKEWT